ncbi:MAG TPA: DUF3300 domain-containing protein, partial [Acidobacteriaceae bacterium]|nr:DUF3300 domain-containing protein [Acidobacteriaceae bacterium]
MNSHQFPHRRWIAGISGLIFTFTGSSLIAQTYGAYGYGSANARQTYGPANPPQNSPQNYGPANAPPTYSDGQPDVAPPPPDYEDNAPYPNQPYAAGPNYGTPGYAENGNYPSQYPQNAGPGYGADPSQQPAQALSDDQLEQLVAPVALYPDTLLAEMLAAATWPQQIIEADQWRQAQGDAPPQVIAAGANAQNWDPSVKALTAFPQVLQQMNQNLQWTTELGNAYYNEPDAVLGTVQALRQRAQGAGTLENSPQETVSDNDGYVQLAPPNPNVMYVPAYNPWTAYGQPIAPWPGYSLLDAVGDVVGPALQYGIGSVLSAFTPFGWLGWGLNWLAGGLFFHGEGWYPHNEGLMDWGLPYGGPRWDWGHGGGPGWDRGWGHGGYGRGGDRGYGRGFDHGYGRGPGQGYGNRGGFGYARGNGLDQRGNYHGPARPPIGNGFSGRQIQGVRGNYAVRGGYGGREQQAWNRTPSFNGGRTAYGRGSYGSSGYAGRGGSTFRGTGGMYGGRTATNRGWGGGGSQGFRSSPGMNGARGGYGGGFRSSAPAYRSPTIARNFGGGSAMRGGFGNSYRGGSSNFSGRGFSGGSSHSGGGFHGV